jgi:hypothetical protein
VREGLAVVRRCLMNNSSSCWKEASCSASCLSHRLALQLTWPARVLLVTGNLQLARAPLVGAQLCGFSICHPCQVPLVPVACCCCCAERSLAAHSCFASASRLFHWYWWCCRCCRLWQIVEWLAEAEDGEVLVILDECHRAKNLVANEGRSTKTGLAVLALQNALPNAR